MDCRPEDQLKKDDDRLDDGRIVRPAARLVGPEQVPPLRPEATLLKRDVGPRRDDLAPIQGAWNALIPPEEPEDQRATESEKHEAGLARGHRLIGRIGSRLDGGHAPAREREREEAEGEEDEGGPLHDRGRAQQRGLIHQRGARSLRYRPGPLPATRARRTVNGPAIYPVELPMSGTPTSAAAVNEIRGARVCPPRTSA